MDFNSLLNYTPPTPQDQIDPNLNPIVRQITQVNQLTNEGNRAVSPLLTGVFASLANEVQDITSQYKALGAEDSFGMTAQQAMIKAQQINQQLMMQRRREQMQVKPQDLQELGALFNQAKQSSSNHKPGISGQDYGASALLGNYEATNRIPQYNQQYFEENNNTGYIQEELPLEFNDTPKNNQHSGYNFGLSEEDKLFFTNQFKELNNNLIKIFDLLKNQIEPKLEINCEEINISETITSNTEKESEQPSFLQFDEVEEVSEKPPVEDIEEEQDNDGQTDQVTYPDSDI